MLKDGLNVECVHQIPQSPFTNALDLGGRATLQSEVKRCQFTKRYSVDALVNTVMLAWRDENLGPVIANVFDYLEKVLILMKEGEGGNDLVQKRGKQHTEIQFDFTLNVSNIQKANRNVVAIEENNKIEMPIANINSDIVHI